MSRMRPEYLASDFFDHSIGAGVGFREEPDDEEEENDEDENDHHDDEDDDEEKDDGYSE